MHARQLRELVGLVLGAELGRLLLELGRVLGGPPVTQQPGTVGLAALVVEAVDDLVADHAADGAVVDRRVGIRIEERRLQDGGREHDLVLDRVVVGVDGLRGHAPLALVHRLADAALAVVPLERHRTLGVAEHVAVGQLQATVVAPLVRVADLQAEVLQLGAGLGLGVLAHPLELVQARAHGHLHVGHQLVHLGLRIGREIQLHVVTADRFAHHRLGEGDTTLPALARLRLAGEELLAELEVGVDEIARQQRRGAVHGMEGLPGLERVQIGVGEDGRHLRDGGVLAHHHLRGVGDARGGEEALPREARRLGVELAHFQRVVGLVAVAALGAGPVGLGDAGFHLHDGLGMRLRVIPAGQLQQLGDVLDVALALGFEVVAQVHLAVAQAQPGLAHVERVVIGIALVVGHADAEEAAGEPAVLRAHQVGDVFLAGGAADGIQVRRKRLRAPRFDGFLVHEPLVQRRDLGGVAVRGRIAQLVAFHQLPHPGLGEVTQGQERAVAGAVGRDLGVFGPGAAHVGEEVFAGGHAGVHAIGVDAPGTHARRRHHVGAGGRRGRGVIGEQGDAIAGVIDAGAPVMGSRRRRERHQRQAGRRKKQGLLQDRVLRNEYATVPPRRAERQLPRVTRSARG